MKPKVNTMTDEVRSMIQLRREAEQRGLFEPLGRLQWLRTTHGLIRFPAIDGECCGPDLAYPLAPGLEEPASHRDDIHYYENLIVLDEWRGLPPLRVNTSKPCPKCRAACDVCASTGKKLCELCGGRSWIPGKWLVCPGAGCTKETGNFKADCKTCGGTGQVPEQLPCSMCGGTKQMTCTRCKGTKKYSTGRVGGSVDWDVTPKCKACGGSTFVGKWVAQDEHKFQNALLSGDKTRAPYRVLGPVSEFAVVDYQSSRTRIFDVGPDAAGDLLVLLTPARLMKPMKAYLVGGVVRERAADRRVSA